jgi:hypothetical protein
VCGNEPTLDLEDERTRDLMRDVELRLCMRREARFRMVGVLLGMAVIFGLWSRHWWWMARGRLYPGLPFLIDQWLMMIVIGLAASKLLEKHFKRQRFPYLSTN